MPRFVRGDDVWQIVQTGKQLEITSGGKPATRTFVTPEQAAAQYDKLVAERIADGFQLAAHDPRHPQLEAVIAREPETAAHYHVLGDWLESLGDPRGRLIALQLAAEAPGAAKKLATAAAKYRDEHTDYFVGPLAALAVAADEPTLEWRFGFIHRAYLRTDREHDRALAPLLEHPSGRFLVSLALVGKDRMDAAVELLARRAPLSLRELRMWRGEHLDLGALWERVPELRRLSVQGHAIELGELELAQLERLIVVDDEMPRTVARAVARNPWPALQELRLDFGRGFMTGASIDDVFAFLARADLGAFNQLGLVHTRYANELVREIAASPIAAQLRALDLSNNFLEDRHALELAANAARFPALASLDVSHNNLTQVGLDALRALGLDVH
jgi:hypothetical protein